MKKHMAEILVLCLKLELIHNQKNKKLQSNAHEQMSHGDNGHYNDDACSQPADQLCSNKSPIGLINNANTCYLNSDNRDATKFSPTIHGTAARHGDPTENLVIPAVPFYIALVSFYKNTIYTGCNITHVQ